MSTTTTNKPPTQRKPRPKPARSIRILEQPGPDTDGWAAVSITVGKKVDTYLLHTIPTDFGNGYLGFEVEKLTAEFETAETYHVLLADRPEECTCDCKGHERHGHCKHREGLDMLVKTGRLPAYRSAGDLARNDPEAFAQHEASIADTFTPRAKDQQPVAIDGE